MTGIDECESHVEVSDSVGQFQECVDLILSVAVCVACLRISRSLFFRVCAAPAPHTLLAVSSLSSSVGNGSVHSDSRGMLLGVGG